MLLKQSLLKLRDRNLADRDLVPYREGRSNTGSLPNDHILWLHADS
jgi:hypothetical protein